MNTERSLLGEEEKTEMKEDKGNVEDGRSNNKPFYVFKKGKDRNGTASS